MFEYQATEVWKVDEPIRSNLNVKDFAQPGDKYKYRKIQNSALLIFEKNCTKVSQFWQRLVLMILSLEWDLICHVHHLLLSRVQSESFHCAENVLGGNISWQNCTSSIKNTYSKFSSEERWALSKIQNFVSLWCSNWKSTNDSGLCGTLPSPQKCPFAKWSLFKLKIKTSEVKLVDHWSTTRDRLDVGKLNQFPVNQRNTFDKIIELHRWRENWGKVVYKALKM